MLESTIAVDHATLILSLFILQVKFVVMMTMVLYLYVVMLGITNGDSGGVRKVFSNS